MFPATSVINNNFGIANARVESLRRRSRRGKIHEDVANMLSTTIDVPVASGTRTTNFVKSKNSVTRKRRTTVEPNERKLRNRSVPREIGASTEEVDKLRNNRFNYLRSRISRIHSTESKLPSPTSTCLEKTFDNATQTFKPSANTTQYPLQSPTASKGKSVKNYQKHSKEKYLIRSLTTSNSLMSSVERQDTERNELVSGVLETVGKRERRKPLRHQDLISESDDEENLSIELRPENHLKNGFVLDSNGALFYCNNCPSYFTSRRGIANHIKLHGVDKRLKCKECDFSCDNYKTLQVHKGFHTAAMKPEKEAENEVSTLLYPQVDLIAEKTVEKTNECSDFDKQNEPGLKNDEETLMNAISNRECACTQCPFISRDQKRLEAHLAGHCRTRGFKCSLCSYMSESAGFLKRHCELHKPKNYNWPPKYIGTRHSRAFKDASDSTSKVNELDKQEKIAENLILSPPSPSQVNDEERSDGVAYSTTAIKRKSRPQKRFCRRNYLCSFCGRYFKNHSTRLLHRVINHPVPTANTKHKLLLKERLNMHGTAKTTKKVKPVVENSIFHCSQCPFSCDQKSSLVRHETKHTIKMEHQCTHCTFSCRSTVILEQHLQLHQNIPKVLLNISKHAKGSSNNEGATTSFTVEDGENTKNHFISRQNEKAVEEEGKQHALQMYNCRWCPYQTQICAKLFSHHKHHRGGCRLRCNNCTFGTSTEKKLREHMKLHEAANETTLSACESTVVTSSAKPTKLPNGEYSCPDCPFTCNSYGKIWNHKQKHKKTSRFQCDLCSYSAGSNLCLLRHRQSHVDQFAKKSSGTKMEEFILVKEENDNKTSNANPMIVAGKSEETEKSVVSVNSSENLRVDCPKDGKSYEFNLRRIAIKLPVFKPLNEADSSSGLRHCKECPYADSDELLFKLHEGMHVGHRAYSCNMCSFSSQCPESLHRHLYLHLPLLSASSSTQNRKRLLKRRFNLSPETISANSKVYQCTKCAYRTAYEDRFQEHRFEHALHIQQRLITSIKRAAQNTERWVKPKIRRNEKRTDKQYMCSKCSFRCDSAPAYNTHFEKHGAKSCFKCGVCDYSAETKNVVDFHVANHHLDVPISFFYKHAVLNPEDSQIKLQSDVDKRKYCLQVINCRRCMYQTIRMADFAEHWEQKHCDPSQNPSTYDLRVAEELRMGIVHSTWIRTI